MNQNQDDGPIIENLNHSPEVPNQETHKPSVVTEQQSEETKPEVKSATVDAENSKEEIVSKIEEVKPSEDTQPEIRPTGNDDKDKVIQRNNPKPEVSQPDYAHEYNVLLKAKDVANQLVKKNVDLGLDAYIKIDMDIEHYIKSLSAEADREKNKQHFINFVELRKLIFSNIARAYEIKKMFRDAIRYDEFIVLQLDQKFHKSYARLIECYRKLNDFTRADAIRKTMERVFDNTILSNYKDIFKNLEDSIREYERSSSKLFKNTIKNLKKMNNEDTDSTADKSKQLSGKKNQVQTKNNFFKWIFGSFIFALSATGLFYLYRNKNRFMSKV